jgi:hypothetical protein
MYSPYIYLIEGIGSTFGLFAMICPPFEMGSTLKCFEQNGITVYPDTTYDCNMILFTGINQPGNLNNLFNLSPNPLSKSSSLKVECNLAGASFLICDVFGKQLFMVPALQTNSEFDVGDLIPGIYIYQFRHKNQTVKQGKLIIIN